MIRNPVFAFVVLLSVVATTSRADNVLDWNLTMRQVINAVPAKANPGLSTRAIGMMNAAIYDVYQAYDHQYQPFFVNDAVPNAGANRDAAVARAAKDILQDCYGEAAATWTPVYNNRISAIADSPTNISNGESLGAYVAQKYIVHHATDGYNVPGSYAPQPGVPGHWTTDPYFMSNPGPVQVQTGWGPGWGAVSPWMMSNPDSFDSVLTDIDGLNLTSAKYTAAYNQVLDYGALSVYGPANTPTSRTADQTKIGKFWGYDVPGFGPPPVLFLKNLEDIAVQTGNTPAKNARLFAMASVAMGDAAIASWDVKFESDFWRPVTAIIAGDNDTNPSTVGDSDWQPLGAPGHGVIAPDFTPPFPAYTSGHATMGGALFKTLELFYGTNDFGAIIGSPGATFSLTSDEPGSGGTRTYSRFTEQNLAALLTDLNSVDSPEGENGISRVFLGIHWIFDATDGIRLGNAVALHVFEAGFQAVPEPGTAVLLCAAFTMALSHRHRRQRA